MKAVRDYLGRLLYFWMESGLLFIGVTLAIQKSFTKIPISLTEWITMAVIFYSSCFAAWEKQRKRAEAAGTTPGTGEKQSFLKDPRLVLDLYGQTGMDAESRLLPHLDKWLTVSGRFAGLAESLLRDSIHVSLTRENGRAFNLRFAIGCRETLLALRHGQKITVVCQVRHGYGLGVFTLENAELAAVEPLRHAESPAFARVSG